MFAIRSVDYEWSQWSDRNLYKWRQKHVYDGDRRRKVDENADDKKIWHLLLVSTEFHKCFDPEIATHVNAGEVKFADSR